MECLFVFNINHSVRGVGCCKPNSDETGYEGNEKKSWQQHVQTECGAEIKLVGHYILFSAEVSVMGMAGPRKPGRTNLGSRAGSPRLRERIGPRDMASVPPIGGSRSSRIGKGIRFGFTLNGLKGSSSRLCGILGSKTSSTIMSSMGSIVPACFKTSHAMLNGLAITRTGGFGIKNPFL